MLAHFPPAVPEMPVRNVAAAAAYYVDVLGFRLDWGGDDGGIGGLSQGACRLFLTTPSFRGVDDGPIGRVTVWLNLDSREDVDAVFARWRDAGARILEAVADRPWNLREFRIADPDDNQLRVFYDFSRDVKEASR